MSESHGQACLSVVCVPHGEKSCYRAVLFAASLLLFESSAIRFKTEKGADDQVKVSSGSTGCPRGFYCNSTKSTSGRSVCRNQSGCVPCSVDPDGKKNDCGCTACQYTPPDVVCTSCETGVLELLFDADYGGERAFCRPSTIPKPFNKYPSLCEGSDVRGGNHVASLGEKWRVKPAGSKQWIDMLARLQPLKLVDGPAPKEGIPVYLMLFRSNGTLLRESSTHWSGAMLLNPDYVLGFRLKQKDEVAIAASSDESRGRIFDIFVDQNSDAGKRGLDWKEETAKLARLWNEAAAEVELELAHEAAVYAHHVKNEGLSAGRTGVTPRRKRLIWDMPLRFAKEISDPLEETIISAHQLPMVQISKEMVKALSACLDLLAEGSLQGEDSMMQHVRETEHEMRIVQAYERLYKKRRYEKFE